MIVTGANGFVGSHLVRELTANGASVTAVVRRDADTWRLDELVPRIRVVRADLDQLQPSGVQRQLGRAELVYHLAAAGTNQAEHDPDVMLNANVIGTYQVLEMTRRVGAKRLVCAGTGFEYGVVSNASETSELRPISVYAATKAAASLVAHASARRDGLSVVTLRTFSVYGPGQARHFVIPYATVRALAGRPIQLTGATQLRDFLYVDDAVRAYLRAGDVQQASGETYNIGSGREVTVRDVVAKIVSLSASSSEVVLGARPYSQHELWASSANIEKAERDLGWRPEISLSDGLEQTIAWFSQHRELYDSHYPDTEP